MAHTIKSTTDLSHKRLFSLPEGARIYTELRKEALEAGYLKPTYGYYLLLVVTDWTAFFLSLYTLFTSNTPLTVFLSSILLGFFFVHAGGLTHDLGHRQVFLSSKLNDIFGMVIGALMAVPYKVWCRNHNLHHANPNEQDLDPDLDSVFTFAEERENNKTGLAGFIRRNQHWLYYLLGSLGGISFRLKGLKHLCTDYQPVPKLDVILLLFGICLWWGTPFVMFPFWKACIAVLTYTFVAGFYLANVFAPNHKGMPQLKKGVEYSFFEQQVITARNVKCGIFLDYVLLGLNYQVEHHLFPNASRCQMKNLHTLTSKVCKKYNVPLVEMDIIETNRFIIQELRAVANIARKEYADLKKRTATHPLLDT